MFIRTWTLQVSFQSIIESLIREDNAKVSADINLLSIVFKDFLLFMLQYAYFTKAMLYLTGIKKSFPFTFF